MKLLSLLFLSRSDYRYPEVGGLVKLDFHRLFTLNLRDSLIERTRLGRPSVFPRRFGNSPPHAV